MRNVGVFFLFTRFLPSALHSIFLLQRVHEHLPELLQVDVLHDDGFVLLFEQLHVVQHHHASGVCTPQLHCHSNLGEEEEGKKKNGFSWMEILKEEEEVGSAHLFTLCYKCVVDGCSHSVGVAGVEPFSFCDLLLIVSRLSFLQTIS